MSIINIRSFNISDYDEVRSVWHCAGLEIRAGDNRESIEKKLRRDSELFLVAEDETGIIGTVMGAYDGRRGWMYHFAVMPDLQKIGVGHELLKELERRLIAYGCPKMNLLVHPDNKKAINFYQQAGFHIQEYRLMGKLL